MESAGEVVVWKKVAVLIVVALLPVSALAHTRLFYRMSCRSDYRKVEVMIATLEPTESPTAEHTGTPLVEIPLESALAPEPTLAPIPTDIPTSTPSVDIIDNEETSDRIATPSDVDG